MLLSTLGTTSISMQLLLSPKSGFLGSPRVAQRSGSITKQTTLTHVYPSKEPYLHQPKRRNRFSDRSPQDDAAHCASSLPRIGSPSNAAAPVDSAASETPATPYRSRGRSRGRYLPAAPADLPGLAGWTSWAPRRPRPRRRAARARPKACGEEEEPRRVEVWRTD